MSGSVRAPARPTSRPAGHQLVLRPGRVQRWVLAGIGVLVLLSVLGQLALHLLPDFPARDFLAYAVFLDNEQNVPTAASFALMLGCAGLLWLIGGLVRSEGGARARYWRVLALLFVLLALDEYMALHERAIDPLREQLGTGGLLNFAWVLPGMAFVALVVAVFGRFALALPRPVRFWAITGAVLFLSGALALEMVGGAYVDRHGNEGLGYAAISTVEETLELLGLAAFLRALLLQLRDHLEPVVIRLPSRGG